MNSADTRIQSLEDLLNNARQQNRAFVLTRRDRLYTAVTLASSVLQLEGTMWLKRMWSSSDIIYHYDYGSTSLRSYRLIKQPYLCWDVFPARATSSGHPIASKPYQIRSEPLLALGLTLVKLSFGQRLSDMQDDRDTDQDELVTKLKLARRLLDKIYDESGCRYGDAVRRCLDCPYDFRDSSFNNEKFQEAMIDTILIPLVQDLNDFDGTPYFR